MSTFHAPRNEYRLTQAEYNRAVKAGVFEPEARTELIDGQLLQMNPRAAVTRP